MPAVEIEIGEQEAEQGRREDRFGDARQMRSSPSATMARTLPQKPKSMAR